MSRLSISGRVTTTASTTSTTATTTTDRTLLNVARRSGPGTSTRTAAGRSGLGGSVADGRVEFGFTDSRRRAGFLGIGDGLHMVTAFAGTRAAAVITEAFGHQAGEFQSTLN